MLSVERMPIDFGNKGTQDIEQTQNIFSPAFYNRVYVFISITLQSFFRLLCTDLKTPVLNTK